MSVRQGILVLLAEQGMHVSQLKAEFEARTGGAWPVNIGQVFTTLQRLERDGLVEKVPHQGAVRARALPCHRRRRGRGALPGGAARSSAAPPPATSSPSSSPSQ